MRCLEFVTLVLWKAVYMMHQTGLIGTESNWKVADLWVPPPNTAVLQILPDSILIMLTSWFDRKDNVVWILH